MSFGLKNAGNTFHRIMDDVLGKQEAAFAYTYDVIVASVGHEQHEQHLADVLSRFEQHGLLLNAEKCELGKSEIEYLGHMVGATGIKPLVANLQTWLGMVNFY